MAAQSISVRFALLSISGLLIVACATERVASPKISAQPRAGLTLKSPIIISVFDGRSSPGKRDVVSPLKADLTRIYGSNLQWSDYFSKTPPGRVSVRIRIVTLGASFGSRVISSVAFAEAVGKAQLNVSTEWGPVIGELNAQQSVFAVSFTGEGWWNGAAWIDLEIDDRRNRKPKRITLPLAAEHREFNMWGYLSGNAAANKAWQKVSAHLLRAMDAIARHVRDQE